jgi:hypothetical protein
LKGKDDIKELFSEGLHSYEAKVRPELWGDLSAKLGSVSSGGAVASTSLALKSAVGLVAAGIITLTVVLLVQDKEQPTKTVTPLAKKRQESGLVQAEKVVSGRANITVEDKEEVDSKDKPKTTHKESKNTVLTAIEVDTSYLEQKQEEHQLRVFVENEAFLPAPKNLVYPEPEIVDPVSIPENEQVVEGSVEINVVFPNVFTPNKDGVNDFLYIKNPEELDPTSFNIVVIDAENKEVFSSSDVYFKWDGYSDIRGEILQPGAYIAIIISNDINRRKAKPIMRMFSIVK